MHNVVNKVTLRLDQYSAEVIPQGCPIFKIPIPSLSGGKFSWKGCFIAPNTALAALKNFSDMNKLTEEKHNEIVNIFNSSLFRTDADKASKDIKLDIVAAPPYSLLKCFGGTLDHTEYRKKYDPQDLFCTVFTQKIPEEEAKGEMYEENDDPRTHSKSDWHIVKFFSDAKCNQDCLNELAKKSHSYEKVPRNLRNCINYLQDCFAAYQPEEIASPLLPSVFTVYVHPEKKNVFAVGPVDGEINRLGSAVLSSKNVPLTAFGDIVYVGKNLPSFSAGRKINKAGKMPKPEQAPEVKVTINLAKKKAAEAAAVAETTPSNTTPMAASKRVKSVGKSKDKEPPHKKAKST